MDVITDITFRYLKTVFVYKVYMKLVNHIFTLVMPETIFCSMLHFTDICCYLFFSGLAIKNLMEFYLQE